jgi:tetratricopeptide (TPR) repeat protein
LIKLLAPLLAFAVTLALIAVMNRSSAPSIPGFADVNSANTEAARGDGFLQKVRETGDPRYYASAEAAFKRALDRDPDSAAALAGLGSLELGKHQFREGLEYARRARAAAPEIVRFYGIEVDALVELGRYEEAGRALQRMVDLKPNLASYARVSYFRELHGNLDGAADAMRLAVSAGGMAAENVAYVQTLLGNLELDRGRLSQATHAYRAAQARYPHYAPAAAGLARVHAARGDLTGAIRRYRSVVTRLPLPEYVVSLAEAELAAGRTAGAERDLDLVRVEERLFRLAGVNTDTEIALFEANHGSRSRAVALAKRAYGNAPSVRSADALGWALTRAGHPGSGLALAERALRLGSRDPLFLYHAGMSARAAGRRELARRYLERSITLNANYSPLYAPRARRALREL